MRLDVAFLFATLRAIWALEHRLLATFELTMTVQRRILVVRLPAAVTGKCFSVHSEQRAYEHVSKMYL